MNLEQKADLVEAIVADREMSVGGKATTRVSKLLTPITTGEIQTAILNSKGKLPKIGPAETQELLKLAPEGILFLMMVAYSEGIVGPAIVTAERVTIEIESGDKALSMSRLARDIQFLVPNIRYFWMGSTKPSRAEIKLRKMLVGA